MGAKVGWHVIGASVQGTAHQKNGIPCQDTHGYRLLPNGTLLVAVADGAGSADRADEGATLAVTKIIDAVETSLQEALPQTKRRWRRLLKKAFKQTRRALNSLAQSEAVQPHLFATTLTCAIVSDGWLAIGQIGDGVAVAQATEGPLFTTLEPQRGEYANETSFLTMEQALEQVQIKVYRRPVQALAVMSDGLVRLALNLAQHTPHQPFFQPLLAFAGQVTDPTQAHSQLVDFLTSDRVCARTDDDKTLVLAVRKNEAM